MLDNKYETISRIGRGAYGMVFKARDKQSNELVALKQIILKSEMKSQLEVFREISTLRNCDHENIIKLVETRFSNTTATLVMEYAESNMKLIIDDERRPLNNEIVRFYFTQIFYGIAYLHNMRIMHRDLKPENILINSNNRVKIADFGLACLYCPEDKRRTYRHQVATRWYRAPELLFSSNNYNPKVDIWAIGCILAEFFNGTPFFMGSSDIEQIMKIFQILGTPTSTTWPDWDRLPDSGKVTFEQIEPVNDWKTLVSLYADDDEKNPQGCLALIRRMLSLNPDNRPDALSCLRWGFFSRQLPKHLDYYRPPTMYESLAEKRNNELRFDQELVKIQSIS